MKKILAIAAASLLMIGFVGCNDKGASVSKDAKMAMDSLSMAFGDLYGSGMGQQLRGMDSTINMDQALKGIEYIANADTSKNFMAGLQLGMQIAQLYAGIEQQCGMPINKTLFMSHLREALKKTTPMGQEDMMMLQSKIEPLLNKAMEQSPKAIANKKAGEEYMSKLKSDKSYTFTKSGIAYKVLNAGEGKNFSDSDVVKVNYVGRHLDGTEFDKSGDAPATFNLKQVIPGFSEMIQLMKPGSKVTVVIPGELAYGPVATAASSPTRPWYSTSRPWVLTTAPRIPPVPRSTSLPRSNQNMIE